ncbi:Gfo/Idh/MocA family protein [Paracoccus sulfuroxidans]|uniref:D-galactose 1-dehydrogenase/L-arabinose 1-dehydrogenase n=1 Tax=Paracoccus sulfuroxidans TaxID=384678 RepID=A0A562NNE9_9RHOB|nr:Gfo/Idh/MocA family oxidoreductase [Paracoccus sulfuroxidans]TWI33276.1 D-galactose 1-dehydrogenase/L-arabinose 1- dehydrogenase [Paracoccus sulfuroxidans]
MPPVEPGLAIIGYGKIAREQHKPALDASPNWHLAATVDPVNRAEGVPAFTDLATFLREMPQVGAVALCTPPQVRFAVAREALLAGKHVLLEKPPGTTVSEVMTLRRIAADRGLSLFAAWHSQFAPGIPGARDWLAGRHVTGITVTWREDVRRWHPGQDWIFAPGGTGVFDPGINAYSILTHILPVALYTTEAELDFPANRDTPLAARLKMLSEDGAPVDLDFDFRETGVQTWDMQITTDDGVMQLSQGGATIIAGGRTIAAESSLSGEYDRIYTRFAQLIARGESDVDLAPFRHVADAMMLGRRKQTDAFEW